MIVAFFAFRLYKLLSLNFVIILSKLSTRSDFLYLHYFYNSIKLKVWDFILFYALKGDLMKEVLVVLLIIMKMYIQQL